MSEQDTERAEQFLGGAPLKTEDARELEKRLAKDGHQSLSELPLILTRKNGF